MKVTWIAETPYNDATPAFRYTDEERNMLIKALEEYLDRRPVGTVTTQDQPIFRMLSTHKSIEAAVVVMRKAQ